MRMWPELKVVLWVLVWLALFDTGINAALQLQRMLRTTLWHYFEYGRSVEGKLAREAAEFPQRGGLIWNAGWIAPEVLKALPDEPSPGHDRLVAVYGQSFTMHASNAAAAMDGRLTLRRFGGPAAPPSHSYAAYLADEPLRKADAVVFGILSTSVPDMASLSGLLWHFENPAPYTFPRFRLDGAGQLVAEPPLIQTEAQFQQAFRQQTPLWKDFKSQLERSDRGYDRLTFEQTAADRSAIVRLLRRGWISHREAYDRGVYSRSSGFNAQAEEVRVLRAMLLDLKRRTGVRGERLIVLLLHSRGEGNHLHAALHETLASAQIEYISTHTLFSANDPQNFQPDHHYVPAANRRLAEALQRRIRQAPAAP